MAELVRIADCPPVPWKNGAGTTRELWSSRDEAGAALIRISIAEISGAQDFSTFPGIDRVIVQLDGPRMVLTIGSMSHPLTLLVPLPFAGEAQVSCALDGDALAHDLNLMCLRSDYRPAMVRRVVEDGAVAARAPKGGVAAIMALSDCALIAGGDYRLGPQDLLLMRDGAEAVALGAADVMVMTAEPAAR